MVKPMKRIISLLLALILMVGVLSSCVAEEETAAESSSDVPTADSEAAESINTSQPKPVDTDGMLYVILNILPIFVVFT